MEKLASKVLAIILGNMHDRFINYLVKGNTVIFDYYAVFFNRLNKEKMLFHQDNAPVNTSMKAMTKFNKLK